MRIVFVFGFACSLLLLSACSTIIEGTDDTVTVTTNPSGASCTLERDGKIVGAVNPTPGSIVVDKSKDNISVICEKDGFQASAGSLESEFAGATLGNILLGGFIGVAVDVASGASNKYPASVNIVLVPDGFENEKDRDAFFDNRVAVAEKEAALSREEVVTNCQNQPSELCESKQKKLDRGYETELNEIERQRRAARVSAKQ